MIASMAVAWQAGCSAHSRTRRTATVVARRPGAMYAVIARIGFQTTASASI